MQPKRVPLFLNHSIFCHKKHRIWGFLVVFWAHNKRTLGHWCMEQADPEKDTGKSRYIASWSKVYEPNDRDRGNCCLRGLIKNNLIPILIQPIENLMHIVNRGDSNHALPQITGMNSTREIPW